MILGIQNPYEADFGIIENGQVKLFNVGGRFLREAPIDINIISRQRPFKCISVLSSGGSVEACFFGENTYKKMGSLKTVENLIMGRANGFGPMKRLVMNGEAHGIRYQQVIFVYLPSVNIFSLEGFI